MAMEKGIQKGIQQERLNFIFRLLKRKVGDLSSELEGKIRNLSSDTLEDLGEALLDFNSTSDLIDWLDHCLD